MFPSFFPGGSALPGTTTATHLPLIPPTASSISSVALMSTAPSATPVLTLHTTSGGLTPSSWGLPLLSTLLTTPLSAPPVAMKARPLIISPALPPIPAKIVERVQSGEFVDFKEFLANNVLLVHRLQELGHTGAHLSPLSHALTSNSRLREINDPLTWAPCFLAFMATSLELQGARDLVAYGMIVLQLACKHSGINWLLYDRQFRQHRPAGPPCYDRTSIPPCWQPLYWDIQVKVLTTSVLCV